MKLKGKVALVTGAGVKFGRAIAIGYAREGADIFLHESPKNKNKLGEVAKIVEATGQKVATGVYEITRGDEVDALTRRVIQEFGHVDILVNTTSDGAHGVFFDLSEEEWDKCVDAGLKSYFLTCQYVGKEMARRGTGRIINLSSIVGRIGSGGAVPWSAARGGVDAMTKAIAHALGFYGIRVNALAHGGVESNSYTVAAREERLRRLPFGRLGIEDDVVGPAIFLATSDSDWVHGVILYVDGGYTGAAVTDDEHRPKEVPYRGR
jgi:NAD(P)-dependent dehydrogenase (short-subunit alcohol dehydrogenase family)